MLWGGMCGGGIKAMSKRDCMMKRQKSIGGGHAVLRDKA